METVQSTASAALEEDHHHQPRSLTPPAPIPGALQHSARYYSLPDSGRVRAFPFLHQHPQPCTPSLPLLSEFWSCKGNLLFEGPLITCRALVKPRCVSSYSSANTTTTSCTCTRTRTKAQGRNKQLGTV